jgi:hypothetical protein
VLVAQWRGVAIHRGYRTVFIGRTIEHGLGQCSATRNVNRCLFGREGEGDDDGKNGE